MLHDSNRRLALIAPSPSSFQSPPEPTRSVTESESGRAQIAGAFDPCCSFIAEAGGARLPSKVRPQARDCPWNGFEVTGEEAR